MPSKKGLFFSDVKSNNSHVMINTLDTVKNKYTVKESLMHIRCNLFKIL